MREPKSRAPLPSGDIPQRTDAGCAGIFQRERSRAPLRCSRFDSGFRPFAAVGDGLVPALTTASGDTSPERDH